MEMVKGSVLDPFAVTATLTLLQVVGHIPVPHIRKVRGHTLSFFALPVPVSLISTFVKMLLWYLTLALSLTSRWTLCFFHPCSALKMTPFLSVTHHNILIHPLISSCLDYCTSLYAGPVGPLCPVSSLVAGLLMENSEWAVVSSCLSTNTFMVWLLTTSTQRDVFTPKLWNRIPLTARSAPSLNLLKLLLKLIFTHWVWGTQSPRAVWTLVIIIVIICVFFSCTVLQFCVPHLGV